MKETISVHKAVLISGLAYLGVFVISTIGSTLGIEHLLVRDNAAITFENISNQTDLFRFGIFCLFLVIVCDIIVAWGLYIMFRPVNKDLSLFTAWFRIVFSVIYAIAILNLFFVTNFTNAAEYLASFDSTYMQSQVMLLVTKYDSLVRLSFIFFGIHIGLLAYLIKKSDFVPDYLAYMLGVAFVGYMIDSFGILCTLDHFEIFKGKARIAMAQPPHHFFIEELRMTFEYFGNPNSHGAI